VDEDRGLLAEPKFKVRVNQTTPRGIEYEVRYFILPRNISPSRARHAVNSAIVAYLDQAGIRIAYPRSEIYRLPTAGTTGVQATNKEAVELDDDGDFT
jgi:small-conductance mechanosensitive channel